MPSAYHRERIVSWDRQIRKTRRLARIAFVIDFLILAVTITCAILLCVLTFDMSMDDVRNVLLWSFAVSCLISVLVVHAVTKRSDVIEACAAGRDMHRQTSGVVYDVVSEMAIAAQCPMPDVYVTETDIPNAYAVSDGKMSSVIVTTALLKVVNREELQGVVAHEIGHIVSGDCPDMTRLVALTAMTGFVSGIAFRMIGGGGGGDSDGDGDSGLLVLVLLIVSVFFLIFSPLLAQLVQSASSRDRERRADAFSAKLTRNPTALAKALLDLDAAEPVMGKEASKFYGQAAAIAFRVPARNENGKKSSVYDTHPPTDERVQALVDMGANPSELHGKNKLTVMEMMGTINE